MSTILDRPLRPSRSAALLGAVTLSLLLLGGLAQVPAADTVVKAAVNPATVQIANFKFAPPTLTVTAGTTVTWKNEDDAPHRIAARNNAFRSDALDNEDSFSQTFTTVGEYPYICSLHPYMVGKIIVKPAGSAS